MSTQHWRRGLDRPILMIPGPTEVPWRVIRAMAQPPMIQYEPPFDDEILEPACLDLRHVFQTSGEVIAMPGSGRTGLEAAAVSLVEPGDRALVVVAGVFGSLMKEVMERAGAAVTAFDVELGRPIDMEALERAVAKVRPKIVTLVHNETSTGVTYPAGAVGEITRRHGALFLLDTVSSLAGLDVQTDAWGVDVNMTGSQKCLAMPLGLADRVGVAARVRGDGAASRARPPPMPTTSFAGSASGSRPPAAVGCRRAAGATSRCRCPPTSSQALREGGQPDPRGGHAQPHPAPPHRR